MRGTNKYEVVYVSSTTFCHGALSARHSEMIDREVKEVQSRNAQLHEGHACSIWGCFHAHGRHTGVTRRFFHLTGPISSRRPSDSPELVVVARSQVACSLRPQGDTDGDTGLEASGAGSSLMFTSFRSSLSGGDRCDSGRHVHATEPSDQPRLALDSSDRRGAVFVPATATKEVTVSCPSDCRDLAEIWLPLVPCLSESTVVDHRCCSSFAHRPECFFLNSDTDSVGDISRSGEEADVAPPIEARVASLGMLCGLVREIQNTGTRHEVPTPSCQKVVSSRQCGLLWERSSMESRE